MDGSLGLEQGDCETWSRHARKTSSQTNGAVERFVGLMKGVGIMLLLAAMLGAGSWLWAVEVEAEIARVGGLRPKASGFFFGYRAVAKFLCGKKGWHPREHTTFW